MNTEYTITTESQRTEIRAKWESIQSKRAILPAERMGTIQDVTIFLIENQALLDDLLEFDALIHRYVFTPYEQEGKKAPSAASVALVEARRIQQDALKENRRALDAQDKLSKELEEIKQAGTASKEETPITAAALTHSPNLTQYGLVDDKLSKNLVSDQIYLQERDGQMCLAMCVDQGKKDGGKHILTRIMLSTADGTGITTSQRIYAEDDAVAMTVANMIYTEKLNGNPGPYNFTPDQIWRVEKGITDQSITPTPKQKKEVVRIIDKLRNTQMKIDVRDELEAHYLKEDDHMTVKKKDDHITEGYIEDLYMYSRKGHAKTEKGRVYDSYVFYDIPYLYTYNMSKGHIVLVDYRLLDTSDTTGNDSLTDVFKFYLLREIASMYQHKRDSKRILFDTLRKATGTPTPEERAKEKPHNTENALKTAAKAQAKDDRDKVTAILKSWTQAKWINGYSDVKDGRTFVGVDIVLNPKNYAPKAITKKD